VLCSLDEERGRQAVAEFGVGEFTSDVETLFARDDLDVIDICTPPDSHFALSKRAIEAGKHVICEKPLFGSIADVDAMSALVAGTDPQVHAHLPVPLWHGPAKAQAADRAGPDRQAVPHHRRDAFGGVVRPITKCRGVANGPASWAGACWVTPSTPMTCSTMSMAPVPRFSPMARRW
jgi:hypothetical protein